MKKKEYLRLITGLSVGLCFLAIITLSYWSSTVKLRGLEGHNTGKKRGGGVNLNAWTYLLWGGEHACEFNLISLK